MKSMYRAMQVASPGLLQPDERPTRPPGAGEVLMASEPRTHVGQSRTTAGVRFASRGLR